MECNGYGYWTNHCNPKKADSQTHHGMTSSPKNPQLVGRRWCTLMTSACTTPGKFQNSNQTKRRKTIQKNIHCMVEFRWQISAILFYNERWRIFAIYWNLPPFLRGENRGRFPKHFLVMCRWQIFAKLDFLLFSERIWLRKKIRRWVHARLTNIHNWKNLLPNFFPGV